MIVTRLRDIKSESLFYRLDDFIKKGEFYLKLEGLNFAGSIKLKTAIYMIDDLEKKHNIHPSKTKIIESSSGNLGLALSLVCKEKGYHFTCVVDPNICTTSERYLKLFGTHLIKVTERDESGGYLGARIKKIQEIIANDSSYIWTNQYANENNTLAHYQETALEIYHEIKHLDYLFIGAGTTGTLMGCAKFFKEYSPHTKIIAVDSLGSVTFGFSPGKRFIPGLGTSRKPELVNQTIIDDIVLVHEKDGALMCHELLDKYGLFLGGSSGSVLQAVKNYPYHMNNPSIVAISPDFGHKYVDNLYDKQWIKEKFSYEF